MHEAFTAAGGRAEYHHIADYLGLTLETVSRALSRLHELRILGFIGNNQRQIMLLDRQQLASLDLQN
jgi:CRP/FNR family nitrogen fixation transcriptional regulator